MEQLNRIQLKNILLNEKHGPIARKQHEYELDGLELEIDDEVSDIIIDRVIQENLGARSAVNIVSEILGEYNYDMLEQGYHKIHIHPGMLSDGQSQFSKGTGQQINEYKRNDSGNRYPSYFKT